VAVVNQHYARLKADMRPVGRDSGGSVWAGRGLSVEQARQDPVRLQLPAHWQVQLELLDHFEVERERARKHAGIGAADAHLEDWNLGTFNLIT
jgi:hypothetical protein